MKLIRQPFLLINKIQNYAWGMTGINAYIPGLLDISPESDKPYAELWMGVHPNAPSEIEWNNKQILLDRLIKEYPEEMLGKSTAEIYSNSLPFLLKVLSADEALSIQVHPSIDQAKILHKNDPQHYPDDNHKPEIAIALDSLLAIVGFKPFPSLVQTFNLYPEIIAFIGNDLVQTFKNLKSPVEQKKQLKIMYSSMMKKSITDKMSLKTQLDQIEKRLVLKNALSIEEKYFLELKKKYQADVGLFSIFLFNLVELKAGEGIFLEAGVPHAYLKGNIIECMANSDNVIRAGLTPKFKDINTLVDLLSYEMKSIPILRSMDKNEWVYKAAVFEFQITRWKLDSKIDIETVTNNKPAILILIEGKIDLCWNDQHHVIANKGQSMFIPAFLDRYKIISQKPTLIFKAEVP